MLTEGGTYGGGVADVQPVYNFLGDTYNSTTPAGAATASTTPAGAQGDGALVHEHHDPEPEPAAADDFQDPCPTTTNAFYSNAQLQMFVGTGVGSDDIVGHELTHGVTNFESALVYQNESGAMNESISDVFGESVDLVNGAGTDTAADRWQIGEDSSLGVIRDMADPPNFNDPDKMTSRYWWFDQ